MPWLCSPRDQTVQPVACAAPDVHDPSRFQRPEPRPAQHGEHATLKIVHGKDVRRIAPVVTPRASPPGVRGANPGFLGAGPISCHDLHGAGRHKRAVTTWRAEPGGKLIPRTWSTRRAIAS